MEEKTIVIGPDIFTTNEKNIDIIFNTIFSSKDEEGKDEIISGLDFFGKSEVNYGLWKTFLDKKIENFKNELINIVAFYPGVVFVLKYLLENDLNVKDLHLIINEPQKSKKDIFNLKISGHLPFDPNEIENIRAKVSNIYFWGKN